MTGVLNLEPGANYDAHGGNAMGEYQRDGIFRSIDLGAG